MPTPRVFSAIVACHVSGVIGIDGRLPWHIPEDLKFFASTTAGSIMVCGRVTYEEMQHVNLRDRKLIVVSATLANKPPRDDVQFIASPLDLNAAVAKADPSGAAPVYVIGGGQLLGSLDHRINSAWVTSIAGPLAVYGHEQSVTTWFLPETFVTADEHPTLTFQNYTYSRAYYVRAEPHG